MAKQLSIYASFGKKDPSKPSSEDRKKTKRLNDAVYDQSKRKRCFQEAWKVGRPWLYYDPEQDLMFCQLCKVNKHGHAEVKGSFVVGTSSFQHTSVTRHENSDKHVREQKADECHSLPQNQRPAEIILNKLNKEQMEQLALTFRNAHALAKKNRPFTDFVWMNTLPNDQILM